MGEASGAQGRTEAGTALAAPDGRYLDADPPALDLFGVTLDVFREKQIGDFSPPQYGALERALWMLWVLSDLERAEGGGTVVHAGGKECRVWVGLKRISDGNIELTFRPLDEPLRKPPSMKVQDLLGRWRDIERELAERPSDHPDRAELVARIDALREEYHRRTGNH